MRRWKGKDLPNKADKGKITSTDMSRDSAVDRILLTSEYYRMRHSPSNQSKNEARLGALENRWQPEHATAHWTVCERSVHGLCTVCAHYPAGHAYAPNHSVLAALRYHGTERHYTWHRLPSYSTSPYWDVIPRPCICPCILSESA